MDSLDTDFSNEVISDQDLPHYEEVTLTPIDKNYLYLLLFQNFTFATVLMLITHLLYIFVEDFPFKLYLIAEIFLLIFLIFRIIFALVTFKKRGYALREHDIIFKSGVLVEITTIVPYQKIQHLVFERSMWEKLLGLSRLEIYTSGGGSSDLDLFGIQDEKLKQIQELLQQKMQKDNSLKEDYYSLKTDHEE